MCHICYDGTVGVCVCSMCSESVCQNHIAELEPKTLCEMCLREKAKLEAKVSQDVGGSYIFLTQFGGFMQSLLDIEDPAVRDKIEPNRPSRN